MDGLDALLNDALLKDDLQTGFVAVEVMMGPYSQHSLAPAWRLRTAEQKAPPTLRSFVTMPARR